MNSPEVLFLSSSVQSGTDIISALDKTLIQAKKKQEANRKLKAKQPKTLRVTQNCSFITDEELVQSFFHSRAKKPRKYNYENETRKQMQHLKDDSMKYHELIQEFKCLQNKLCKMKTHCFKLSKEHDMSFQTIKQLKGDLKNAKKQLSKALMRKEKTMKVKLRKLRKTLRRIMIGPCLKSWLFQTMAEKIQLNFRMKLEARVKKYSSLHQLKIAAKHKQKHVRAWHEHMKLKIAETKKFRNKHEQASMIKNKIFYQWAVLMRKHRTKALLKSRQRFRIQMNSFLTSRSRKTNEKLMRGIFSSWQILRKVHKHNRKRALSKRVLRDLRVKAKVFNKMKEWLHGIKRTNLIVIRTVRLKKKHLKLKIFHQFKSETDSSLRTKKSLKKLFFLRWEKTMLRCFSHWQMKIKKIVASKPVISFTLNKSQMRLMRASLTKWQSFLRRKHFLKTTKEKTQMTSRCWLKQQAFNRWLVDHRRRRNVKRFVLECFTSRSNSLLLSNLRLWCRLAKRKTRMMFRCIYRLKTFSSRRTNNQPIVHLRHWKNVSQKLTSSFKTKTIWQLKQRQAKQEKQRKMLVEYLDRNEEKIILLAEQERMRHIFNLWRRIQLKTELNMKNANSTMKASAFAKKIKSLGVHLIETVTTRNTTKLKAKILLKWMISTLIHFGARKKIKLLFCIRRLFILRTTQQTWHENSVSQSQASLNLFSKMKVIELCYRRKIIFEKLTFMRKLHKQSKTVKLIFLRNEAKRARNAFLELRLRMRHIEKKQQVMNLWKYNYFSKQLQKVKKQHDQTKQKVCLSFAWHQFNAYTRQSRFEKNLLSLLSKRDISRSKHSCFQSWMRMTSWNSKKRILTTFQSLKQNMLTMKIKKLKTINKSRHSWLLFLKKLENKKHNQNLLGCCKLLISLKSKKLKQPRFFYNWLHITLKEKNKAQQDESLKSFINCFTEIQRLLVRNENFSLKMLLTDLHQFLFINFHVILNGLLFEISETDVFLNLFNNQRLSVNEVEENWKQCKRQGKLWFCFEREFTDDEQTSEKKLVCFLNFASKLVQEFIEKSKRKKKRARQKLVIRNEVKKLEILKHEAVKKCSQQIKLVEKIEKKKNYTVSLLGRLRASSNTISLSRSNSIATSGSLDSVRNV